MVRSSLLFVGLIVDIATKFETTGVGTDENGNTRGWSTFQNSNNVLHVTCIRSFPISNGYGEFTLTCH